MNIIRTMETAVVWSLDGAIFGLLAVVISNIIKAKLSEIKRK